MHEEKDYTRFFTYLNLFTFFMLINVFLAFFNLLPIPPFDGSHIVEGVLPRSAASAYRRLRPVGMVLFLGLVALTWYGPTSGVLDHLIGPPVYWMLERFDGLTRLVDSSACPFGICSTSSASDRPTTTCATTVHAV